MLFIEPVTGFLLIDALLSGDNGAFGSTVTHLVLPTIVLGTGPLAVVARMTRSAMLEVLSEDYIRTARAKGLPCAARRGDPCAAQCTDPGRHGHRAAGRRAVGCDSDRDDLRLAGRGPWLVELVTSRLPGGAGRRAADCHAGDAGQPQVDVTYGMLNPRIRMSEAALPSRNVPAVRRASCVSSGGLSPRTGALAGLLVMTLLVLLAVSADLVAPHSPIEQFRDHSLPPVWQQGGSFVYPLHR